MNTNDLDITEDEANAFIAELRELSGKHNMFLETDWDAHTDDQVVTIVKGIPPGWEMYTIVNRELQRNHNRWVVIL